MEHRKPKPSRRPQQQLAAIRPLNQNLEDVESFPSFNSVCAVSTSAVANAIVTSDDANKNKVVVGRRKILGFQRRSKSFLDLFSPRKRLITRKSNYLVTCEDASSHSGRTFCALSPPINPLGPRRYFSNLTFRTNRDPKRPSTALTIFWSKIKFLTYLTLWCR